MNPAETILAEIGEGPATVGLESGAEYEIEFDDVDVEGSGFHASGTDRSDDEILYRIDQPQHSDDPLVLERRHTGETDWEQLGRVEFASQDG